jgi:hypothetical protein
MAGMRQTNAVIAECPLIIPESTSFYDSRLVKWRCDKHTKPV